MLANWGKNPFLKGVSRSLSNDDIKLDLPPAVREARLRLGWSDNVSSNSRENLPSSSSIRERSQRRVSTKGEADFRISDFELVTHSGERLVRVRKGAPWKPFAGGVGPSRGNLDLALSIASNPSRVAEIGVMFEALALAPGSRESKASLFNTWTKISVAAGVDPLPLTSELMTLNTGILRSAGYRAVKAFLYEAKSRHIREGWSWSASLQLSLQDCKRAGGRAIGKAQKSGEVRLDAWKRLVDIVGLMPVHGEVSCKFTGGLAAWIVGSLFILREVELSSLTLDTACLAFNEEKFLVTLSLPVSKSDPCGRGAKRTLGCSCAKGESCPFHLLKWMVEQQVKISGVNRHDFERACETPLLASKTAPSRFLNKEEVIDEVRKHVRLLNELKICEDVVDEETITGHFMRRSGIKNLARKGCTFTSIQWMARHSSQVTWGYIEDAWSENPRESLQLYDNLSITETLSAALARVSNVEEVLKTYEMKMSERLTRDGFSIDTEEFKESVRKEARNSLFPKYILNQQSQVVHENFASFCMESDPRNWVTKCGWNWVCSGIRFTFVYEGEDLPPNSKVCRKCEGI